MLHYPCPITEQLKYSLLQAFCSLFHATSPMKVPVFCFSWLELISHRWFLPKLLGVSVT